MCALPDLYIQAYLCTQMSYELVFFFQFVVTAVFLSVSIIKTTLKTIVLGSLS